MIAAINDQSTTIASAVEEQTATVAEISRNISEAAVGSSVIAADVTRVASAAEDGTTNAGVTRGDAEEIARAATAPRTLVNTFRY